MGNDIQSASLKHLPNVMLYQKTFDGEPEGDVLMEVSFSGKDGKEKTYSTKDNTDLHGTIFGQIRKYSTPDDPDIKPKELSKMSETIFKNKQHVYLDFDGIKDAFDDYKKLIKEFTDKKSPGGKKITPEEQTSFLEEWCGKFFEKE